MASLAGCNWLDEYQWFQKTDSRILHGQTMGSINSLFHLQHITGKKNWMTSLSEAAAPLDF